MVHNALSDSLLTFVSEAFRLIGWPRLLLGLLSLLLIGALALWLASKIFCRGEKHLAASLTSPVMLALVGTMTGAVYLVTMLRGLSGPDDQNTGVMLVPCAALALAMIFMGVHGSFGTRWWKSAVLTLVLVGSVAGAAKAAAGLVFSGQPAQLAVLADQVTGRTAEGTWLIQSPEATRRIQMRRAPLEKQQLEKRQGELTQVYANLQTLRSTLDPQDADAVAAFNAKAAAYTAECNSIKARLVEVQALIQQKTDPEANETSPRSDWH
jgi:hypothetical protein